MGNKLDNLIVYLVDNNSSITRHLALSFADESNVKVFHQDFIEFMKDHSEVDCIVSPANSFGEMTGGFDYALSEYLGWDFQLKVQKYIDDNFYGEQLVGTSFIIDTDRENLKLIHTPTMREPEKIIDERIVYQCMRSTLMCALENNVKCIVIPAFGGACGGVNPILISSYMKKAYCQIKNHKINNKH